MKPTKLLIKNIGIVADETILIDKPLLIFYGEIRQGKTTLLNAVRWVCGGEFPTDILRHGTKEGHIELQFQHGHIRREFYLAKDGKTVNARPIEFVREGRPVGKPVQEIQKLLNPFTLDQDYLIRMKEADRNRYFLELFGVNTSDIDAALYALEKSASDLRSELKGYGEIDLTKVEPVDVGQLKSKRQTIVDSAATQRRELESQLQKIDADHAAAVELNDNGNELARSHNASVDRALENKRIREQSIADLKRQLADQEMELVKISIPLKSELKPRPVAPDTAALKSKILTLHSPDTADLDTQLSNAAAANVRAEQYQKNLARETERKGKVETLETKEKAVKSKREEKIARLKSINESCKIPSLTFTDEGEFLYEETTAAMLSTSQLMKLSSALSDLYPPGLGIELLDRGESLGKSIFELIDRAKADEKTILATVVGERPAMVPEQIGVFVIEDGHIKEEAV